ncbi:Hypothetical protein MYEA_7130 [Mycoplasma yeatsii 13926]|uniref:YokE-like PH domain-containing protein n=1 Tax=Mycoplasma yeatsii 13926 TaxID=1188240 RepID=S6G3C1_9MOLU|nr:PH domain-containing protein [Mycoplasma yeatsii]EOA06941.1 Hypothetical protein MYEA_7130 [Mycoplasma yeatsii 13926]
MKSKESIINDLKNNLSNNLDLVNKKEFDDLVNLFFDDEEIIDLLVVGIENKAWLLTLTNKRLFFVKKHNLYNNVIKQYGLEQLKDLRLTDSTQFASLSFIFENDFIKVENITLNEAKLIGKKIAQSNINWLDEINDMVK